MEKLVSLTDTVNIKFCEPSYYRSLNIAEYWNAITSFAYCIPPIIMYFQVMKYKKKFPIYFPLKTLVLYFFCGISWCFLAFGSAIFHATQTGWGEILDEIGMILASSSCCFSLADMHPLTTSRIGAYFYFFFSLLTIFSSVVYVNLASHAFFSVYFIASLVIQVLLVASLPVTVRKFNKRVYFEEKHPEEEEKVTLVDQYRESFSLLDVQSWLRLGFFSAVTGYAIWHVDQRCVHEGWHVPSDYPYEMYWFYWAHPLWHFLTAAGAACFMKAIFFARIETFQSPLLRRIKTGSFVMKTTIPKAMIQSFMPNRF